MKKILLVILLLFFTACEKKDIPYKFKYANEPANIVEEAEDNIKEMERELIGKNEVTLYLFYLSTCPHCHAEIEWLDEIKDKYKYLKIVKYEANEHNSEYYKVLTEMGITEYSVPLTIIGSYHHIGINLSAKEEIISTIEDYSKVEHCDMVNTILSNGDVTSCNNKNEKNFKK